MREASKDWFAHGSDSRDQSVSLQIVACTCLYLYVALLKVKNFQYNTQKGCDKFVISTFHYHFMDFVSLECSINTFMFAGDHDHHVSTLCQLHCWRNPRSTGRFCFRRMNYDEIHLTPIAFQHFAGTATELLHLAFRLNWLGPEFYKVMTCRTWLNNHMFITVMYSLRTFFIVFPDSQDNVEFSRWVSCSAILRS